MKTKRITYDTNALVLADDYLQSSRSIYRIVRARAVRRRKPSPLLRFSLDVVPVGMIPDGAYVHELRWYPRKPSAPTKSHLR